MSGMLSNSEAKEITIGKLKILIEDIEIGRLLVEELSDNIVKRSYGYNPEDHKREITITCGYSKDDKR